jgi:penicillin V acylase-like amidase (Ntn superfamily)
MLKKLTFLCLTLGVLLLSGAANAGTQCTRFTATTSDGQTVTCYACQTAVYCFTN